MLTLTPRIGLIGEAAWISAAEQGLQAHEYAPLRFHALATFIDDVLDHYPALLIIDGDQAGWRRWITTSKTEQATRRLPVLVVAQDTACEAEALSTGADLFLPANRLEHDLLPTVDAHALIPAPALIEALLCECTNDLPKLAQQGVEKFNKGAFYAQHDAFEDQWMEETGPVRELYRAVLQVGVAYYHITRGNHAGGLKMLRRVVQWFARLPDECQGIDVKQLRQDAAEVRAVLATMDPADIRSFDRALLKPVPMVKK